MTKVTILNCIYGSLCNLSVTIETKEDLKRNVVGFLYMLFEIYPHYKNVVEFDLDKYMEDNISIYKNKDLGIFITEINKEDVKYFVFKVTRRNVITDEEIDVNIPITGDYQCSINVLNNIISHFDSTFNGKTLTVDMLYPDRENCTKRSVLVKTSTNFHVEIRYAYESHL